MGLTRPEPLRTEVRKAWGESIRVIWLVMIPFGGIGFIISLFMKQMKLETVTDEVRVFSLSFFLVLLGL